jgi:DnaK suppressor protein
MDEVDNAAQLHAVRDRAVERVLDLARTHSAIVEASESANLDDEHDPEGATVGFERAQVAALLERARAEVAELDAAVERAGRGEYGFCESCGARIGPDRLAARPATRICIACARVQPR